MYKNVISLELIVIFYISSLLGIKDCNFNIKNYSTVTSTMRTIVTKIISDMYNSDMEKIDKWLGVRLETYAQIIFDKNSENIEDDVFLHFLSNIKDVLNTELNNNFFMEDIKNEFTAILIAFPDTISKLIKQRIEK